MLPHIEILGRAIPMYWLSGVAGLLLAGLLAMWRRRAPRFKAPADDVLHTMLLCVVGAMIGAKALQVIGHVIRGAAQPGFWTLETWAALMSGGGVFYGGLLGGLAAAFIYIRKYKLDPWDMTDILVPSVLLFHAFGRLGCFFAGCCHGRPADWGITFENALACCANDLPLIPVQLFEAGFNLFVMTALLVLRPERKHPGILLPLYLLAYSIARFGLEFLRGDAGRGIVLLSTSQWISLALLPAAAVLLWRVLRRGREKAPS